MRIEWLPFVLSFIALAEFRPAAAQLSQLINKVEPSVVAVRSDDSAGTGFVVDNDIIVTNHHVIEDTGRVTIVFKNGPRIPSTGVRHLDKERDLAVIAVSVPAGVNALPVQQNLPVKGEDVAAVGHPEGHPHTWTKGIVSGITTGAFLNTLPLRKEPYEGIWIQTDAAISPGNSGGPLLAIATGEVVGINSFVNRGKERTAQNLNFAISCLDLAAAIATAKASPLRSYREVFPPKMPSQADLSTISFAADPDPRFFTTQAGRKVVVRQLRKVLLRRDNQVRQLVSKGADPSRAAVEASKKILLDVAKYLVEEESEEPAKAVVAAAVFLAQYDGQEVAQMKYSSRQAAVRAARIQQMTNAMSAVYLRNAIDRYQNAFR